MSDPNRRPQWSDTIPSGQATDSEVQRWSDDWDAAAIKTPRGALLLISILLVASIAFVALVVWPK